MTSKLATVKYPGGTKLYSPFSTTTDFCSTELYIDEGLQERSSFPNDEVSFVDIDVAGYEKWTGIASRQSLIAPLTPFSTELEDGFEGIEDEGVIHLRKLRYIGPALCGRELPAGIQNPKKYVFTDAYGCTDDLKGHEIISDSIYSAAKQGKVCRECAMANEVRIAANH